MVVPKSSTTKQQLEKLMLDKEQLEQKISEYGEILNANGNIGMNGSLFDTAGYPRSDIDLFQVRQARQQIICLQNDHKSLMIEIEKLLHQFHAEAADENNSAKLRGNDSIHSHNSSNSSNTEACCHATIAKVNLVSTGSPGELAGLRINDNIIEFGSINSTNFENNLNQIGMIVKQMENQRVPLKIKRNNEVLDLVLIPKKWNGRGLLGCNIVLPENVDR